MTRVVPNQSSACLVCLVSVRNTSGLWTSVLIEKHLSSCRKPNPKMTEICIILSLLMNCFACSYQPLTKSRDFYCTFVHLNKYPGKYTASIFGFGVVAIVIEVNREGSGQHFLMLALEA